MNRRHPIRAVALCLATVWLVTSAAADNAPPLIASYKIDVQLKLDEQQQPSRLEGHEQLTWRNASPDAIRELQFHLYLNAFKNQRSTFFRESGGQLRGDRFAAGEWGWIDINELKIAGGADLSKRLEFIQPDDGNVDDQTVVRVPLDKPLPPGATLTLEIRFTVKLPRVFARTGYWKQFALVGQWFPKIGVWEEVGERRRAVAGWNCHQFHANSEFYADFGNYDVTLTVPAIYKGKLGATGQQLQERGEQVNADGTVTYRFAQTNVHDFAWTVDPQYVVLKRTFKASEWVKPAELEQMAQRLKLPLEAVRLRDVECTLLLQPEHLDQTERHFNAAFNALKHYGLWYGAYPYNTLTIVDPPFNGEGAGGMEYPTFITAGTEWWLTPRWQEPETVIVHEFGHQYWYGLVASNEFEESWLDEGFNTYSETKTMGAAYGALRLPFKVHGVPLADFPVELPHPYEQRLGLFLGKFNDPLLTPAWRYFNSNSYALNSYPRTGLTLVTLENYLGADVMARVMREYATKWRYRHPTSQDFFDTAQQVAGQDLSWFFDQFVKGTQTLDYEVTDFYSARPATKLGLYDQNSQKIETKDAKTDDKAPFENEVTVRRQGEAWFPVELLVTLKGGKSVFFKPAVARDGTIEYQVSNSEDGKQWTESWPLNDRWKKFRFSTAAEIHYVQFDPRNKVQLDANLTNNSKTKMTALGATARWSFGLAFWLQALLQALAAFC